MLYPPLLFEDQHCFRVFVSFVRVEKGAFAQKFIRTKKFESLETKACLLRQGSTTAYNLLINLPKLENSPHQHHQITAHFFTRPKEQTEESKWLSIQQLVSALPSLPSSWCACSSGVVSVVKKGMMTLSMGTVGATTADVEDTTTSMKVHRRTSKSSHLGTHQSEPIVEENTFDLASKRKHR